MFIKNKVSESAENNIFWVTMTDLMTALVLVFMVLFFYTYVTSAYSQIQGKAEQQKTVEELQESLKEKNIDISVDALGGIVKINDLDLFEVNSSELSQKGKQYLATFAPAYFDSIFSNEYLKENIGHIVIQGHTDSQTFAGDYTQDQQYMLNMQLSMKRAFAVANYMINTPYNKVNGDMLRKMIIVEGVGSSQPILTLDGKEDLEKSRRVELKIVMKEKSSNDKTLQNKDTEEPENGEQLENREQ